MRMWTSFNTRFPLVHTFHTFNGSLSGITRVSRYQKGKTNLDFNGARDSEWQWQWHQLGHMQASTSLQTDNHASTPPLSFLQAGCPSCRPTNSVKALKVPPWSTKKSATKLLLDRCIRCCRAHSCAQRTDTPTTERAMCVAIGCIRAVHAVWPESD